LRSQRLAERSDVEAQTAFFDRDVGPDLGHQRALADSLVRARDQSDQGIERAGAQSDRDAIFQEDPASRVQAEWTERHDVSVLRRRLDHGV